MVHLFALYLPLASFSCKNEILNSNEEKKKKSKSDQTEKGISMICHPLFQKTGIFSPGREKLYLIITETSSLQLK